MNICPITYEPCAGEQFSKVGLRRLSRRLLTLHPLPFTARQQIREAAARASKMSIQGVQPKLSAVLDIKGGRFKVVDRGGKFILKPQNPLYLNVPENEDLCMKMASAAGIDVPLTGLVSSVDASWTYFIRRFDRVSRSGKRHVEDFAQLAGKSRDTKYDASMEQVTELVAQFCTFPRVELARLFRLTIFNFIIGNEDMHLKNFSIVLADEKVSLSPAYDLLSTTLAMGGAATEELALPLGGRKNPVNRELLVDYLGKERMGLPDKVIDRILSEIRDAVLVWKHLVSVSFLPSAMKAPFNSLLQDRLARLGFAQE